MEEEFSCKLPTICYKSLMAPFSLLSEQEPPRHSDKILCCLTKAGVKSGEHQEAAAHPWLTTAWAKHVCDILSWNSLCWKLLRHEVSWRSKPSLLFSELVSREQQEKYLLGNGDRADSWETLRRGPNLPRDGFSLSVAAELGGGSLSFYFIYQLTPS